MRYPKNWGDSWIKRCFIQPRDNETNKIVCGKRTPSHEALTNVKVQLDGYAIIPLEVYKALGGETTFL